MLTAAPPSEIALLQPAASAAIVETFPVKGLDEIKVTERDPLDKVKREPKGGKQPYSIEALVQLQKVEQINYPDAKLKVRETAHWLWPLSGAVTVPFMAGTFHGVDIAGKAGDSIVAVADGRVIYAGPGVHAFGKLIIIRHTRDYISVYAHASEALISEGQNVTRGEKIAKLSSSHTSPSKLHFEIHFQGEPVDPQKYLSPR